MNRLNKEPTPLLSFHQDPNAAGCDKKASKVAKKAFKNYQKACKTSHPQNHYADGKANKGIFLRIQRSLAERSVIVASFFRRLVGLNKVKGVQYTDNIKETNNIKPSASASMTKTDYMAKLMEIINKTSSEKKHHLDRTADDWKGFTGDDIKQGIANHIKKNPQNESAIGDMFEDFILSDDSDTSPPNDNNDKLPVSVKAEFNLKGRSASHGLKGKCEPQTETTEFLKGLLPDGKTSLNLVGINSQHALGAGASGIATKGPNTANAYRPDTAQPGGSSTAAKDCIPGGSSSGGTTSVATGAVVTAVGSDGGGSGRICPGLQGCVGLSTGAGYFNTTNSSYQNPDTLVSPAIISRNIQDNAQTSLDLIPEDTIKCFDHSKIGVYIDQDSLNIAKAGGGDGKEISARCQSLFESWQKEFRPQENESHSLSLHQLGEHPSNARNIASSHITIFGTEEKNAFNDLSPEQRAGADDELRLNLAMVKTTSKRSLATAQNNRVAFQNHLKFLYEEKGIGVICMPTTLRTARGILPGERESGLADLRGSLEYSQFTNLANLASTAAITVPAGVDKNGMPIGFMLMSTTPEIGPNELLLLGAEFQNITRNDEQFNTPEPTISVYEDIKTAHDARLKRHHG
ncbi:MAG: amidase family protein [Candidatus Endonucleobacter bathymodioli]|uniref:Amidase family protein n=1 Tax=Candidatus Endonucleibacter bathymodioli TaxID=539814 RepID=A0AA90NM15_9GAMM|nr:amidase family protein [Candidatus Endonucleobacter bathymodioli]